jgi:hypothetical protein
MARPCASKPADCGSSQIPPVLQWHWQLDSENDTEKPRARCWTERRMHPWTDGWFSWRPGNILAGTDDFRDVGAPSDAAFRLSVNARASRRGVQWGSAPLRSFLSPMTGGQRGLKPRSDERAGCCASGIARDGEPGRRRYSVATGFTLIHARMHCSAPQYCTFSLCTVELMVNCHSLDIATGGSIMRLCMWQTPLVTAPEIEVDIIPSS